MILLVYNRVLVILKNTPPPLLKSDKNLGSVTCVWILTVGHSFWGVTFTFLFGTLIPTHLWTTREEDETEIQNAKKIRPKRWFHEICYSILRLFWYMFVFVSTFIIKNIWTVLTYTFVIFESQHILTVYNIHMRKIYFLHSRD